MWISSWKGAACSASPWSGTPMPWRASGIRFRHVGGTSAGAINALMVAGLDTPDKPKSSKVLKILADLEMFSFVDGDSDAQDFVRAMVEGAGWIKMMWKGFQVADNIIEDLGLNPGDAFRRWVEEQLKRANIDSVVGLEYRMTCPNLFLRDDTKLPKTACRGRLGIVAADISTGTKVVFPDMADLYWAQPETLNPAWLVRASMSIPGFFQPMRVANIPQGEDAISNWSDKAGYRGRLPKEVLFVDGGIISNFPIRPVPFAVRAAGANAGGQARGRSESASRGPKAGATARGGFRCSPPRSRLRLSESAPRLSTPRRLHRDRRFIIGLTSTWLRTPRWTSSSVEWRRR